MLLLGIDFGTSYFKVGLFDADGRLQGLGRVRVDTDMPGPGRCEIPVPRFWTLLQRGLAEALAAAGASAREIAAVSYSSQSNTFVLLDEADAPLTPLVVWTDERGGRVPADLAAFSGTSEFARTAGFSGWSGGFAVAKWRWFQENEPHTWARMRRVLTLPEFFTYSLTGELAGDASTAAFTGLYDLARATWWPEALAAARVELRQLAVPHRPGSVVGRTTTRAAELLGLPTGLPFAVGGLDHHVAALGSGLGTNADVSISTGTVLAAITLVRAPGPLPGCYHGPDFDGTRFYRLAFESRGAGQIEDYQKEKAPELSLEQLFALAADAEAADTGRNPSGAAHGLAFRGLLEEIARTQRKLVEQVTAGRRISRIVATGGGARSPLWLQIQADTIGVPVITPGSSERACLGAAMLAGVATGWRPDLRAAAEAMISPGRVFEPRSPESGR